MEKNDTYRRKQCKACRKQATAEYAINNPHIIEERRQKRKKHRIENKEIYKNRNKAAYQKNPRKFTNKRYEQVLKRAYGISLDEYNKMSEQQNHCCKICFKPRHLGNKKYKRLCVDHDHTSGKVRGLLCDACNRGLGLLKDNLEVLRRAYKYVAKKGQI